MTRAEARFKQLVRGLVRAGLYPSPTTINRHRDTTGVAKLHVHHSLNGRECRWRDEVLRELGWVHDFGTLATGPHNKTRAWRRES